MSWKKLAILLIVPLGLIALIPVLAPSAFEGANEAAASRIAGVLGEIYGFYLVVVVAFFVLGRVPKKA